jgi:CheY-like chemotaxis protein
MNLAPPGPRPRRRADRPASAILTARSRPRGASVDTGPVPARVMIVDDHSDVRYLLRAVLEESREDVVVVAEAASGEEAMTMIGGVDPDVVVLDALMPVRDGFETAALIRAARPEQPILLCSAVIDDAVRTRASAVGIAACLPKDALEDIPPTVATLAGA